MTTTISTWAEVIAGCHRCGVVTITNRQQGNELCLYNGYHSRSVLILLGLLFSAIFTHLLRVFPLNIDSGSPTTTFSVSNMHIIAAAIQVKVVPRPISSTTSASAISECQTHLCTTYHNTETWHTWNQVPGGGDI